MDEKGNVPIYYGLLADGRKKNKKMIDREREKERNARRAAKERERQRENKKKHLTFSLPPSFLRRKKEEKEEREGREAGWQASKQGIRRRTKARQGKTREREREERRENTLSERAAQIKGPPPTLKTFIEPLTIRLGKKKKKRDKSPEQRLNLSRSWHKGHSHTYNTLFPI